MALWRDAGLAAMGRRGVVTARASEVTREVEVVVLMERYRACGDETAAIGSAETASALQKSDIGIAGMWGLV